MLLTLPVRSLVRETPRTRIVRVALGDRGFSFRAGQSAMLGLHGQPLRRPYSIACAPEDARRQGILEFLVKVDAAGDAGPHLGALRRGMPIDVEGPFGGFYFPVAPLERRFLFVAGGTGIAPLRAMLRHALEIRCPGRLRLLYSARTPDDFAYLPEFRRLAREGRVDVVLTASRGAGRTWKGEHGRIGLAQLAALVDDPATLCFVCGPPALIETVPPLLTRLGIAPARVRIEEW